MSAIVRLFKHSLGLSFFGILMKTDLFQSCGHCWVFQICWHTDCNTFTASSFKIWNSSSGIPSPPLALLAVMLPKAHLTLHSRMSGSRWVITPLWLPGLWRSFLYNSSVYSYHLLLICSASVRSIPFLSFIEPIFAQNVPLVSLVFLKRSLVFPILLFSSITLHWSLRKAFSSLLAVLGTLHSNGNIFPFPLCFLLFFSQLFVRPPQTAMLLFCISFSWGWSWFLSHVQCHKPLSIVQIIMEKNMKKNIYLCNWVTLLFRRNHHNIVSQPYLINVLKLDHYHSFNVKYIRYWILLNVFEGPDLLFQIGVKWKKPTYRLIEVTYFKQSWRFRSQRGIMWWKQ